MQISTNLTGAPALPSASRTNAASQKQEAPRPDQVSLGQDPPPVSSVKPVVSQGPATPTPASLAQTGGGTALAALAAAPGTGAAAAALTLSEQLSRARQQLKPEDVNTVLYHKDCFDGTGAAFAAWKVLGDHARYIPVSDHDHAPELPADAKVAVVDFSFQRPVLEDLKSKVAGLVVLDHHKTAQEHLQGLDYAVFDMGRSGAGISWEYFHPDQPEPELLKYVEDRDIWTNKLPQTNEVNSALASYPKDFQTWDKLSVDQLKQEGTPILRYRSQLVDEAIKRTRMGKLDQWDIPVLNVPAELRSDIGDELCKRHPECPFVALYYVDQDNVQNWSLRSRGDFDVAKLAETYGGGGHKNAAAFRVQPGQTCPVQ